MTDPARSTDPFTYPRTSIPPCRNGEALHDFDVFERQTQSSEDGSAAFSAPCSYYCRRCLMLVDATIYPQEEVEVEEGAPAPDDAEGEGEARP